MMVKMWAQKQTGLHLNPTVPLPGCVILGMSHLSVPLLLFCKMEVIILIAPLFLQVVRKAK